MSKISKIYTEFIKINRKRWETPEETLQNNLQFLIAIFFQNMEIGVISREAFEFITTLDIPGLPDTTDIGFDRILDVSAIGVIGSVELTLNGEIRPQKYKLIAISHKLALLEMRVIPWYSIPGSFIVGHRMYMVAPLSSLTEEENLSAFRFLFWFFENYERFDFAKKPISEEGREWWTLLPTGRHYSKNKNDVIPMEWLVAGHFRLQPYGRGRENHKLIFIWPQKRQRHVEE